MQKLLFEVNQITSLGSADAEEDLKPKDGINTTHPSDEDCCGCCGRPVSALKPFGKAGDPLVGDFDGDLLVKRYRWDAAPDEGLNEIIDELWKTEEVYDKVMSKLIEEYGQEEAEQMILHYQLSTYISPSW